MITHIRHKGLKLLYEEDDRSKLRPDIAKKARHILTVLDEARTAADINLLGLGVHPLVGDMRGFWSVSVSRNHRIVFRMEEGNVCDVDLIDYH